MPMFRSFRFHDAAARTKVTANSGSGVNAQKPLIVTDYHIGPGVGTYKEQDTNWFQYNNYDTSGNSHEKFKASVLDGTFVRIQSTDGNTIDTDGPVYLFAFAGSDSADNGSGTPAVVKCRLWYMVNSDPSGWARFTAS